MQHRVLARSVPVEWGMLVLDVAGLQHAVTLGVAVGVDHRSSEPSVPVSLNYCFNVLASVTERLIWLFLI